MTRKKKVLHVVHSLQVGGLENGLANLLNRMDSDRFSHAVLCLTEAGKFAERIRLAGVEVLELHLPSGQFRFPLIQLAKIFRKIEPDIVHSRGWPTVDAVFAACLARVPHIVHGEHGRDYSDKDGTNWKRNQVRRVIGGIVDRYLVVCDFFRSWLNQTCKVSAHKIIYIPNGVDTAKFCPLELTHDRSLALNDQLSTFDSQPSAVDTRPVVPCSPRQKLGFAPGAIIVGSVGRLDPVKDIPTLLRGFAKIRGECPEARLAIVGGGPSRSELTGLADDLGLTSVISWLGERHDVPEVMRCFDIFAQTSLFEGMSNTILEAMATGLPVITTKAGGNQELVIDATNGFLIPPTNEAALAQALRRYIRDEQLRVHHGKESRQRTMKYFTISLMAARYTALYQSLGLSRSDGLS